MIVELVCGVISVGWATLLIWMALVHYDQKEKHKDYEAEMERYKEDRFIKKLQAALLSERETQNTTSASPRTQ